MTNLIISDLSDEILFQLLKEHNNTLAYAEIYNRHWENLWRFALKHQVNTDEAKDTLQDVFTYLWENRNTIELKTKLRSYLYRAILNQILKKIDRQKVISLYIQRLGDKMKQHGLLIEDIIYEKELQQKLNEALNEMPCKMRIVFEASRFEEMNYEEIANRHNISKETVKSQIKNALKIIRKHVHVMFFTYL